jgi:hypothetical protein
MRPTAALTTCATLAWMNRQSPVLPWRGMRYFCGSFSARGRCQWAPVVSAGVERHAQLKGTQLVAPVLLHDPARIEAVLCCHFIAMLIQALIERQIRQAMKTAGMKQLSLYPEDRGCAAQTAARVLDIFASLARHHLTDQHGHHIQTFQPQLSELQALVLDLLEIPHTAYTST